MGKGFILSEQTKAFLIQNDKKNLDVIFPYIIGDDLNNSVTTQAGRIVIDFKDMDENQARNYPQCFEILEREVKPIRFKQNRESRKKKWWVFAERASKLYRKIESCHYLFGRSLTSKFHFLVGLNKNQIIDQTIISFCINNIWEFRILNSVIHFEWVNKYSADMMGTGVRYNISRGFETFALPVFPSNFDLGFYEALCWDYLKLRSQLLDSLKMGLTKIYNLVHSKNIKVENISSIELNLDRLSFEKSFGKDFLNFLVHLQKTEGIYSLEESLKGIARIRELHEEIDKATLKAYGWTDIQLRHDFYEVDYLPENDRVRYTIHPDARKEILKRLLDLNHQYFEEEAKQGLHKQEDVEAFYQQKGKPVPPEVSQWFGKKKGKDKGPKESKAKSTKPSPQTSLFDATTPLFSQPSAQKIVVGSKVTLRSTDAKEMKYIIQATGEKGSFTSDGYKVILSDSALAQAMLGKGEGVEFEFEGMEYRVMKVE